MTHTYTYPKLDSGYKAKWLDLLRSGNFPQAKSSLVHFDPDGVLDGYCCLGVACLMFPDSEDVKTDFAIDEREYDTGWASHGSVLPDSVADVLWTSPAVSVYEDDLDGRREYTAHPVNPEILFTDLPPELQALVSEGDYSPPVATLASLNDLGATFAQIADLIERLF